MKRILLILLMLTVALAGFAAGAEEETVSKVELSAPGEFPIVKEPVTLKFFARLHPIVEDMSTNDMSKYMEEITGVKVEWEQVPQNAVNEKRTLLLASGDYPDVLFSVSVTREEEMIYGPQGVFVALNDLIEKHAPNLSKIYADKPHYAQQMTTPDGNMYSMPHINECYHCIYAQRLWINQPFLDAVGLSMPTTTEELYQALKAFKTKDPNGNGKADEIPLSGAVDGWHVKLPAFIMNAFIYFDENGPNNTLFFRMENGKIDFVANKTEWREGLRYMARLYAEGLVDPAAFTQDGSQLRSLGENPDIALLGAGVAGGPNVLTKNGGPSGRYTIYRPVPPLKGPAGFQSLGYYPPTANSDFVVTSASEYPEVAVKWADHLYSREATLRSVFGRRDEDWRFAKDGEVGLNGKQAIWYRFTAFGTLQNSLWAQVGPSYRPIELRQGQVAAEDIYSPQGLNTRLAKITREVYDQGYVPDEVFPPVYMSQDVAAEVSQLKTTIGSYVWEMTARFMIGELSLDSDWDGYLSELDKMGLAQYLKLNQEAYEAQYK